MHSIGRPRGRFFFFCVLIALLACVSVPNDLWATPPKTSVNDILYRADGTPARGTVTIRWSAFTASDNSSVAAGVLAVKIGANGSFAVQLIPNTGAKPEGSYYKVVMKLDDGTTSEEAWAVPAVATTTVAAVRATVMPASAAVQVVGRDYVDTAVANVGAGYVRTEGSYADPTWLSSLSSSKLVGTIPAEILPSTFTNINSGSIRDYGAKCDGTTDDTAALQAAITAAGSDGGKITIPGIKASCYFANPSGVTWPGGKVITLTISGSIKLGTTFVHPSNVVVRCAAGGGPTQFQAGGEVCSIIPPSNTFTLTSAVAGSGSQSVSVSNTAGMAVGGAITIVENTSCTISGVTNTSSTVTVQLSGACHIPPGYNAVVSGVSDSSFNGSQLISQADYVANTLTFTCASCAASGTGGTITGPNEDTIETVNITAISGNNITAVFNNAHGSGASGGIAAWWIKGGSHHELRDVSIGSPTGVGVWIGGPGSGYGDGADNVVTDNVGVMCTSATCQPMEISNAIDVWVKRPALNIVNGFGSWGLRITNTQAVVGSTGGSGLITIDGGVIRGGIKADRATILSYLNFRNVIVEEGRRGAFTYQQIGTSGIIYDVVLDHVWLQDNFHSYALSEIHYTQPAGISTTITVKNNGSGLGIGTYSLVNRHFDGTISDDSTVTTTASLPASFSGRMPVIRRSQPTVIDSELRGAGGNFSPSFIPWATENVPTNAASWSAGACTLTTGLSAPDGGTGAASVAGNSNQTMGIYTRGVTPTVGDYVLYGAWAKGSDAALRIQNSYQQHIQFDGTSYGATVGSNYIANDTWHPIVGLSRVTAFDGTGSAYPQLGLLCGQNAPQYWMPFMIYVPAAQANVPELMRWRQDLLHGVVPPNMPGGVLATGLPLYLSRDPQQASEAATKNYVDSQVSTKAGSGSGAGIVSKVVPTTYSGATSQSGTMYTTSAAGQYRFCGYVSTMTAGSAGTWNLFPQYTGDGHGYNGTAVASVSATTQWAQGGGCTTFYADSGTNIIWYLSSNGVTGSPAIRYTSTLEQLQ